METLLLDPTTIPVEPRTAQLALGLTTVYRVITSLALHQATPPSINWHKAALLRMLRPAFLASSLTRCLVFLLPWRSHRTASLRSLTLAHRARKLLQTPTARLYLNKAVVLRFLQHRVAALEADCAAAAQQERALREELGVAQQAFVETQQQLNCTTDQLEAAQRAAEEQRATIERLQEEAERREAQQQLTQLRVVTLE